MGSLAVWEWVDANPHLIVVAALLAAAGAYPGQRLHSLSVYDLGHRRGPQGQAGAKLGTLQNVAIQQVSAELSHATAPLVAAIKVKPGDTTTTEFSGRYGGDARHLMVSGTVAGSI